MSASSGAEKPRAGKRGRWDMQQTPDVHAPAAKKSAWDEVRPAKRKINNNIIAPEWLIFVCDLTIILFPLRFQPHPPRVSGRRPLVVRRDRRRLARRPVPGSGTPLRLQLLQVQPLLPFQHIVSSNACAGVVKCNFVCLQVARLLEVKVGDGGKPLNGVRRQSGGRPPRR